jgi:hypothetical protein
MDKDQLCEQCGGPLRSKKQTRFCSPQCKGRFHAQQKAGLGEKLEKVEGEVQELRGEVENLWRYFNTILDLAGFPGPEE